MKNPYDNGKVMTPQMTLLAQVFAAGVRASIGAVREKLGEVDKTALEGDEVQAVRKFLDEVDAMFPRATVALEKPDLVQEMRGTHVVARDGLFLWLDGDLGSPRADKNENWYESKDDATWFSAEAAKGWAEVFGGVTVLR